jgi:hypothetical protein
LADEETDEDINNKSIIDTIVRFLKKIHNRNEKFKILLIIIRILLDRFRVV